MSSLSFRTSWLALLGCSFAANVQAAPSSPALHWSRAENAADCVDPRTLAELVETYTGPVLVAPASADTSIEGAIERVSPEEFRMRVSVTVTRGRPAGQRVLTLPATDCRTLDGAIAFVIASTLDPDLGSGSLPSELSWLQSERPAEQELREELDAPPIVARTPQPSAAAAPVRVAPTLELQGEEPTAVPRDNGAWELGLALVAGRGRVPSAAAGGLVSVARTFGSAFALTLHLRVNGIVGGFDAEAGRSVNVQSYDSALLACGRAGNELALHFDSCLGPIVGFFTAHGDGFDQAHTVVQPLYGGQLKLELGYAVASRFSLTVGAIVDVGFRRPTVTYIGLNEWKTLFRSELYGIQGAVGIKRTF
jgi:hypothetical protein